MRLAPDLIVIRIGGESVVLSPSLRAATRIARKHGEFRTTLNAVLDCNLTVIADLIREGSDNHLDLADLIEEVGLSGLGFTLAQIKGPLIEFVLSIAGIDPDTPPQAKPQAGKPISLADYHGNLFEIATGWLGWSPTDAWAATPAEIEAAFNGRTDMLRAILGSADANDDKPAMTAEERAAIEATGMDPEFDRAGLQALKTKIRAA